MKTALSILAVVALAPFTAPDARAAGEPGALVVTLAMEVSVRGVEISVGDVADVTGADAETVRRVRSISLGSAPAPGYSRVLRSDRVLSAITKAVPQAEVHLRGGRACRVFPEVEEVLGARLQKLARARLASEFALDDVDVELIGELRSVSVPAGAETLEVRVRPGRLSGASGTVTVPVDVLVDGQRYQTVWTSWTIRRWETREVLARPVRAGELLDVTHFERRRVQLDPGAPAPLNSSLLDGAVALRDMRAGEAVDVIDVRRPTVVTQGETLFLQVRRGAIEARVPAVALASGAVGDRIRVRTTDAGQELVATIRSRDLCLIDLGGK